MTEPRGDLELLETIALRRDEQAFAELYQLHQQAAFSLARRITGDAESAAEALQEALLRVWRSASSFHAEAGGSVRGWLMTIVARESLKVLRRRRKLRADKRKEPERDMRTPVTGPEEAVAQGEVVSALRSLLDSLPDQERQLLALHFGGGLSHEEVGEALRMPRRTVSFKIDELLQALRSRLAHAGFPAAASVIAADGLREALCSGFTAPAGLGAHVVSQLATSAYAAGESVSRRAVAPATAGTTLALGGVAVLSVVGMSVWYATAQRPAAEPAPLVKPAEPALPVAAKPPLPPPAPAVEPAPAPATLNLRWRFDTGPQAELVPFTGTWNWGTFGAFGTGMRCPADEQVVMLLPAKIPPSPCKVECKVTWPDFAKTAKGGATWCGTNGITPNRAYHSNFKHTQMPREQTLCSYFMDRYSVDLVNGEVRAIREFTQPYPSDRMAVYFKNRVVQEIRITSVRLEEIPAEIRNPAELLKRLDPSAWLLNDSIAHPAPPIQITPTPQK